jgi:hypothetical protein
MASTYTVNIGIEKPGTGDQSGTWGVTTNTNFDIIDQATNGVATVTLSSAGNSGSPNTLLISNGALSDGRNRFIQFNDGADLGATAYVQLDPNDAEKIVHIRNSLSGSRSLILFQGTYNASNDFEVPNGADVLVKFDGGGTGATVTDVNVNLTPTKITTGDLDVDNININGNTISSTDTNGNINITPNGSGAVAFTTNATFGDNDKAQFGAGNDLQIYHDAGHSRIVDAGTGNLRIQADNLRLQSADGVNNYITADNGGAATLYHNALAKLATSSIGVNVTGTVTADGLTVGDGHQIGDETTYDNLVIKSSTDEMVVLSAGGTGQFIYKTGSTTLDNGNEKMRLTNDGKLGIGTTSPATQFHSLGASGTVQTRTSVTGSTASDVAEVAVSTGSRTYLMQSKGSSGDFVIRDSTGAADRITLDSSGNVGIGGLPTYKFQVAAGTDSLVTYSASALDSNIFFDTQNTSTGASAAVVQRLITSDVAGSGSVSADFQKTKAGALNINNNETNSAAFTAFGVGGTERMRIDSSGNVGIGTNSPAGPLEVHKSGGDANVFITTGVTTSSTTILFGDSASDDRGRVHYDHNNDSMRLHTAGSERMRIDSSGNVGIGNSAPATTLHVSGGAMLDGVTVIGRNQTGYDSGGAEVLIDANSGTSPMIWHIGGSEVARIDSGGNLLVGTTDTTPWNNSANTTADNGFVVSSNGTTGITRHQAEALNLNRTGNNGSVLVFQRSGTNEGSVSVTTTGTTYNTTSDIRLKTDINPIADATDKLMAMNAVTHKWKADPDADAVHGFIAQEMQEIVPEAVSKGDNEDDMWSMDYGRITPVLVAALQDAHKKIEELAAEVAKLKAN